MVRRVASIVVAVGFLLTTGIHAVQLSQAGRRATSSASLDEKLSAAVTRGDVPGLVVIAAARDRILYQGVFGKAEVGHERPMAADALFRIASMTKPVTSVAAMQLYERGRFALDDPAEKYLPELANLMVFESFDTVTGAYKVRPAAKKVTIRHLFTHTSGLGYAFTSPIVRDFKPREGEKYSAGPLLFEPGTQWIYGTSVEQTKSWARFGLAAWAKCIALDTKGTRQRTDWGIGAGAASRELQHCWLTEAAESSCRRCREP